MIKNKEFKKLCNLSKTILQKRPNISNLGNPFLFLVSGHPFFLSRYKHINSGLVCGLRGYLQRSKNFNKR